MLEFITTQTEDGILYHGARAFRHRFNLDDCCTVNFIRF